MNDKHPWNMIITDSEQKLLLEAINGYIQEHDGEDWMIKYKMWIAPVKKRLEDSIDEYEKNKS